MSKQRHIAVVTGSRADFGLLRTVMHAIDGHRRLRLSVVAAGLHLVQNSWRDIGRAGFHIAARVTVQQRNKTGHAADVAALGRGVRNFGQTFEQLRPDVVLVLGDRMEILAAALAAHLGGIHLSHIHGGDRAEGVADEAMRHAISKMSHVHFPATAQSRRRLIRMGESAKYVFNVGSPAVDGLNEVQSADDAPTLIVCQHPAGGTDEQEYKWMKATLSATQRWDRLVLAPNADAGSAGIRLALGDAKVDVTEHLPRDRYLALLAGTKVIVGNSSAGLIEAAVLKTPCVNIGPRQGGREKPQNVIDCDYGVKTIRTAITQAMTMNTSRISNPYGDGKTGQRIAELLAELNWGDISKRKRNTY